MNSLYRCDHCGAVFSSVYDPFGVHYCSEACQEISNQAMEVFFTDLKSLYQASCVVNAFVRTIPGFITVWGRDPMGD